MYRSLVFKVVKVSGSELLKNVTDRFVFNKTQNKIFTWFQKQTKTNVILNSELLPDCLVNMVTITPASAFQ